MLIALAVAIYFIGTVGFSMPSCSGWNIINPLCWGGKILDFSIGLLATVLAIYTVIFGILIIVLPQEKTIWIIGLWFFLIIFLIDLFLPDPLPFIDELITGFVTFLFGIKTLKSDDGGGDKKLGLF